MSEPCQYLCFQGQTHLAQTSMQLVAGHGCFLPRLCWRCCQRQTSFRDSSAEALKEEVRWALLVLMMTCHVSFIQVILINWIRDSR